MDPRLRTVAIVLVAAVVGAVVAGGAIQYVNGSKGPAMTVTPYSDETRMTEGDRGERGRDLPQADRGEDEARATDGRGSDESTSSLAPSDAPPVRERPSDDDGPAASVTSDANPAKPRTPTKAAPPVVEESGSAPKVAEDGDGGSVRESTKGSANDGDGGSVR